MQCFHTQVMELFAHKADFPTDRIYNICYPLTAASLWLSLSVPLLFFRLIFALLPHDMVSRWSVSLLSLQVFPSLSDFSVYKAMIVYFHFIFFFFSCPYCVPLIFCSFSPWSLWIHIMYNNVRTQISHTKSCIRQKTVILLYRLTFKLKKESHVHQGWHEDS